MLNCNRNFRSEEAIIHDTQQTEKSIADRNRNGIIENTANIIRRANRVLLVACQEAENCEDSNFNAQLKKVSEGLNESSQSRKNKKQFEDSMIFFFQHFLR